IPPAKSFIPFFADSIQFRTHSHTSSTNASIRIKMRLPVTYFYRSIRDRISTVDHHPAAHINSHMAGTGSIIRSLEEDQIAGLCLTGGNNSTGTHKTACSGSATIPAIADVVDCP